jgi:autotransporter adhesin
LPQAMDPGRSMISAGVGTYRGRAALAIGASHRVSGGNAVIKVGATYDSTEHVGANAGFGIQF